MEWQWTGMFGSILLLDLVLSGDNALVLGAAVARLPRRQRLFALFFGGAGAIIIRIVLSSIAAVILNIPWIQTMGAIILLVIAVRLLDERRKMHQEQEKGVEGESEEIVKKMRSGQENFRTAVLTIFIADVTMSLDNVLAVGAAANGALVPMALGLLISIAIILSGSALIAELMTRFPYLLDLATLVLAWTSGTMIRDDLRSLDLLKPLFASMPTNTLPLILCVLMGCVLLYFHALDWFRSLCRGG